MVDYWKVLVSIVSQFPQVLLCCFSLFPSNKYSFLTILLFIFSLIHIISKCEMVKSERNGKVKIEMQNNFEKNEKDLEKNDNKRGEW